MEEKGASLLRSAPYMAAIYATIGIGGRHTGQACGLGSLFVMLNNAFPEFIGQGLRESPMPSFEHFYC